MSVPSIDLNTLLSTCVHALVVYPVLICGLMLVPVMTVWIFYLLTGWRNKAVHQAVYRALKAEYERQCEDQRLARMAEGKKQYELQLALHSVWEQVTSLSHAFHGTTPQIEADLWEISKLFGALMPALVLPECYRPFYVELMAIARGLTHLGTQIDSGRAEGEDLDFYQKWVEELWARFRLFELKNNNQQRRLQHRLSEIRALHTSLGKHYCLAMYNPAYQRFPGMLHIVELMLEESSVPAEQLSEHVTALMKQLSKLAVSFECERYGFLNGEDSFLNLLLKSCRVHSN
ncbi:hypothetical protein KDA_75230 [Dictyobacter alpinus]|uniref:Uncharacterized protein n=1 Tax=Dictyobacter alpinus TaxID=2014873 RepID=A0A402BL44_9CHLR|nr:hypothetical protein [Dictyobacter alpinus]GCE32039.1 hypothetical protein KDA_75230 [Dictyobacter alpinus]